MLPGMSGFDPPEACNPLADNPLRCREDVERALRDLVSPLERFRSSGGARVRIGHAGAHPDAVATDLEGFARPLWGLAPAQAGGAGWIDWEPIRRGLVAGTDPDHPEYWGPAQDHDQRLVESAAIGLALRLVPDQIWHPLSAAEKERAVAYFLAARQKRYHGNNWVLFRLLLDMGLAAIGAPADDTGNLANADQIERLHLGEGWYVDGHEKCVDHYAAFTIHGLCLILAALDDKRPERGALYRERARQSAGDIMRWFADDGPVLAFGRSLTYRFAVAGYLGALALAGEEVMPWGVLKGFYLRHLRWWSRQPFTSAAGLLEVGHAYPNALIGEEYNSPQSSYWALQAFLPLALPASHPFWHSPEAPAPARPEPAVLKHAGMIIANPPGDAIALVTGQELNSFRSGPEKYCKFAYSARYGFSIESDLRRFEQAALDNSIGFSDDGRHFRVRESHKSARIAEATLYSLWRPYPGVTVESWTYWHEAFHIRVHRVKTPASILTIEGGFAVGAPSIANRNRPGMAVVETQTDCSAIADLGSSVDRSVRIHRAPPNTNLIAPRSLVPQLFAELPAGTSILACAVIAQGDVASVRAALDRLPPQPDVAALADLVQRKGVDVTVWARRETD